MPISGPSSYPPTMREFFNHWTLVNATLGVGSELVLAGNRTISFLETYIPALDAARDEVTDAGVDRALAREELNGLIAVLQAKMVEFNRRVRADLPGSAYERSLEEAFAIGDAEEKVRQGLRATARLWGKINAITPAPDGVVLPLVLRGYTLESFNTDREALRLKYGALSDAEMDLRIAREKRNDMQDLVYPVLKSYRQKVPVMLPEEHALVDSLPVLTPADTHTPEPVVATGVWDAAAGKAKITWTASAEATLARYEVRGVPGDLYETEDEVVLASFEPEEPREFLTDFALGAPEVSASFKVYVVLTTGNERGSEAVTVTRPG